MFKKIKQYLNTRSLKDVSETIYEGDETIPILLVEAVTQVASDLISGWGIKDVRELSLDLIRIRERLEDREEIILKVDNYATFHRANFADRRNKFLRYSNRVAVAYDVMLILLSSEPFTKEEKEYLALVREVGKIVDEEHQKLCETVSKADKFIKKHSLSED